MTTKRQLTALATNSTPFATIDRAVILPKTQLISDLGPTRSAHLPICTSSLLHSTMNLPTISSVEADVQPGETHEEDTMSLPAVDPLEGNAQRSDMSEGTTTDASAVDIRGADTQSSEIYKERIVAMNSGFGRGGKGGKGLGLGGGKRHRKASHNQ